MVVSTKKHELQQTQLEECLNELRMVSELNKSQEKILLETENLLENIFY